MWFFFPISTLWLSSIPKVVTPLISPSKITKIPSIQKLSYLFALKVIFIILLGKINSIIPYGNKAYPQDSNWGKKHHRMLCEKSWNHKSVDGIYPLIKIGWHVICFWKKWWAGLLIYPHGEWELFLAEMSFNWKKIKNKKGNSIYNHFSFLSTAICFCYKFISHSTLYFTQSFEPIQNHSPSPLLEMHFQNPLMASGFVFSKVNESFWKCISGNHSKLASENAFFGSCRWLLDLHFRKPLRFH